MTYKAIILDLDGVILESNQIKDDAFTFVFQEYPQYFNAIMDYHHQNHGLIRFKKFKYVTENILHKTYDAATEESLAKRFSGYVLERIKNCPFVTGAKEFLDYFCHRLPLFLVSANPPEDLNQVLRFKAIDHFFKEVYATDEKIQAIENILENYQWQAQNVVFIGDSWQDHQAALETKVDFLGRNSGSFKDANHFKVFSNLDEIKEYLIASVKKSEHV